MITCRLGIRFGKSCRIAVQVGVCPLPHLVAGWGAANLFTIDHDQRHLIQK